MSPQPHGRPAARHVIAAVASFAIGFVAMRGMRRDVQQPVPVSAAVSTPALAAEQAMDDPAAASRARIDAVFAFGEKRAGLLRDHALYAALRKLEAADFLTAAGELPALLERVKDEDRRDTARAEFLEAWMDRWLELDAPGARRFLGGAPFLGELLAREKSATVASAAFRALARREPHWTHRFLAAQPATVARDAGISTLLNAAQRTTKREKMCC